MSAPIPVRSEAKRKVFGMLYSDAITTRKRPKSGLERHLYVIAVSVFRRLSGLQNIQLHATEKINTINEKHNSNKRNDND